MQLFPNDRKLIDADRDRVLGDCNLYALFYVGIEEYLVHFVLAALLQVVILDTLVCVGTVYMLRQGYVPLYVDLCD